jgi:hypothetical protein
MRRDRNKKMKHYLKTLYWLWRISLFAEPWFALKTFIHLHWHARATAIALDNYCKASGQMDHIKGELDYMKMPLSTRSQLTIEAHSILPRWKWR